jgi:hypothetical protein
VKSEIRNPKAEGNSKLEIRNVSGRRNPSLGFWASFGFRPSDFGFFSAFGSRISDFLPVLALALVVALSAHAQPNAPHVGYVYPAGGRQGATFQVVVGGQFLSGVTNVCFSGDGIRATVLEYNRPLTQKEFTDLRDKFRELREKRRNAQPAAGNRGVRAGAATSTNTWTSADETMLVEIRNKILKNPPNRQGNPAIAETITLQLAVDADAEPGDREVRLATPASLSNPLRFCIGQLPEFSQLAAKTYPEANFVRELFNGNPPATAAANAERRVSLPAVVNGQIMPGQIDRIRFAARKGQQLVVTASARELIPYLADAVPGWFQAVLTLCDANGKELAYDDRFRFHPDPVIHCEIPKDGDYVLEIKDSLFRGREDFVYRITLGELPFITSIFPLGGPAHGQTAVELSGWNLGVTNLVETNSEAGVRSIVVSRNDRLSNPVPFAVDTLPECPDQEPNDSTARAQPVMLPIIVNGRIDVPGDRDCFRFEGKAGDEVVAEVYARRLDSPLDSVLALTDVAGRQLALNDDHEDKGTGLITHHADSYLRATLPADGIYLLNLIDAQHQGGAEFAYRLRISRPRPDFELRIVPSSVTARGGTASLTVYALRKDGFTNEIVIGLRAAPIGATLSGARIPANQDQARFTLSLPPMSPKEPLVLSLEGRAQVDGQAICRAAVPAEDCMQAFAYRHLVPAKELRVAVLERGLPRVRILSPTPVMIPAGGTASVRIGTPSAAFADRFQVELSEPPDGIRIDRVGPSSAGGTEIVVRADAAKVKPGMEGNLIVNILPGKTPPGAQRGNAPANRPRAPLGTLPAIPFRIAAD